MNELVDMNYVAWYLPYFPKSIGSIIQKHQPDLEFALCVITGKKKRREKKFFC